jgi:MOSC domain-containing protein YiiM
MTTDIRENIEAQNTTRTGRIIAVCYSAELINGVGKEQHDEAQVTRWGIPGDRHYGETRISNSLKEPVPNDRAISVVGVEATRGAAERLGIEPIPYGGIGENFLVEGLGDLGELTSGDQVHFLSPDGEPNVVLEVSRQNAPCSNVQVYHKLMVKELYGKRGILCTVLKEGTARVGDTVRIVRDGPDLY